MLLRFGERFALLLLVHYGITPKHTVCFVSRDLHGDRLLHASFQHRRKTLLNNWHGRFAPDQARNLLAEAGLAETVRAEAVPAQVWRGLFERACPNP